MNNLPTVTKNILILNALLFLGKIALSRQGIDLTEWMGLHFFMASAFNPVQLVTYMFMHANFEHILFNMFTVWMFGRTLEMVWGPKRFLTYYLVCGIGAGLVQEVAQYLEYLTTLASYSSVNLNGMIISMNDYLNLMTTVGASGAVFGILLAFGMLFPNVPMYLMLFPFPIKTKYMVAGYAVLELMLAFGTSHDGVAHFAHLGGMLFGYLLIIHWKKKHNNGQFYY